MESYSSIAMRMYRNTTGRQLQWRNPWGHIVTLGPGRGCTAAPCEELAQLIRKGEVQEQSDYRGRIELPWSTERQLPL
jgi:hypothetical protein